MATSLDLSGKPRYRKATGGIQPAVAARRHARVTGKPRPFRPRSTQTLPRIYATGAVIGRAAPVLMPPIIDIALRDRLFSEIQALRRQQDLQPTGTRHAQIQSLEARLIDLLAPLAQRGADR